MIKKKLELLEKKRRKSELKKNSDQIIQDVQVAITDSQKGELVLSTDIIQAIKPIKVDSPLLEKSLAPLKFYQTTKEKQGILTFNIELLDDQISETSEKIKKLKRSFDQLEMEKLEIKKFIRRDEDLIHNNEIKLEILDSMDWMPRHHPDTSDFIRRFVEIITRTPDEVLINLRLSRLDVKLVQRQRQLIQIDKTLANLSIALQYQKDLLQGLEQTGVEYRKIRLEIGKNNRQLKEIISKEQVETVQQSIMNTFLDNLQKVNQASENFQSLMNINVRQMYEKYNTNFNLNDFNLNDFKLNQILDNSSSELED